MFHLKKIQCTGYLQCMKCCLIANILRTVQDHEFVKWVIFCILYYLKLFQTEKLTKGKTIFYYGRNIRKVMKGGGGGEGKKTRKLCKRNCSNKIPEKKTQRKKRNFPQDGSHIDIKSVLLWYWEKTNERSLHVAREVLVQCVYFLINQLQSQ